MVCATHLAMNAKPIFLEGGPHMLQLAVVFLVIALLAGALGLWATEAVASQIAWIFFVVFLILFVVSFIFGRRLPPA